MTVNDTSVGQPDEEGGGVLELLREGEQRWLVVPVDADGDQRLTNWITVEAELLCDLEEWR